MTYLACENTPIKPEITRDIDQLEICGHFLTYGDVDEVAGDEGGGRESGLHTVTEDDDVGGEHTTDRGHDARSGKVLPGVKDCLKDDDDKEDDSEGEVGRLRVRVPQWFPAQKTFCHVRSDATFYHSL